jgi:hypothetical protein
LKRLTIGYGQKYLLSLLIKEENMFDIPHDETEGTLVTALFAPSNTINPRSAWHQLMKHRHYVITMPYRREMDDEIWEGEYSDYLYTADELSPFLPIADFIGMISNRGMEKEGADLTTGEAKKWVVISSIFRPSQFQLPLDNQTHWVKVLTIKMREKLGHNNETLHRIRKLVARAHGFETLPDSDPVTAVDGEGSVEIAGHLINMLLASHVYPVDVVRYSGMIRANLDGERTVEPTMEPFEDMWHREIDWRLALEVYVLMAKGLGLRVNHNLVDLVAMRLGRLRPRPVS